MTRGARHGRVHGRFALRLAGFAIDLAILVATMNVVTTALTVALSVALYALGLSLNSQAAPVSAPLAIVPWIGPIVALGLLTYCGRWLGGSPGHVAVGLAVFDARTGQPARVGQILGRSLLLFAPAVVALRGTVFGYPVFDAFEARPEPATIAIAAIPAIALLWYPVLAYAALVRPSGRTLHDRITHTYVDWTDTDDDAGEADEAIRTAD